MTTTPNNLPNPEQLEERLVLSLEEFLDRLERGSMTKDGTVPIESVASFIRTIAVLNGGDEHASLHAILWDNILNPATSEEDAIQEKLSQGETVTIDADFSGEIVALLAESAKELSRYVAHSDLSVRAAQLAKLLAIVPRYDFRPPMVTPVINGQVQHVEYGKTPMRAVPLNPAQRDDLVNTLKDAGKVLTLTDIGAKAVKVALALEAIEPVDVVRLRVVND